MKYKFEVKVALTYKDKDIEVEVELSDKEVARIKEIVDASTATDNEPNDEDEYVPEKSLLYILLHVFRVVLLLICVPGAPVCVSEIGK